MGRRSHQFAGSDEQSSDDQSRGDQSAREKSGVRPGAQRLAPTVAGVGGVLGYAAALASGSNGPLGAAVGAGLGAVLALVVRAGRG